MLGRKSPPPHETEAIKRYGWRDQGVLVVSAEDVSDCTWPEREMVRQLGSKLYGRTTRENADDRTDAGPRRWSRSASSKRPTS